MRVEKGENLARSRKGRREKMPCGPAHIYVCRYVCIPSEEKAKRAAGTRSLMGRSCGGGALCEARIPVFMGLVYIAPRRW